MNCARMRALLDDYVDGELLVDEAAQAEAHLRGCASCRRAAERLQALSDRVAALPAPALAEGFAQRLRDRLGREAPAALSRADTAPTALLAEHTCADVAQAVLLRYTGRAA